MYTFVFVVMAGLTKGPFTARCPAQMPAAGRCHQDAVGVVCKRLVGDCRLYCYGVVLSLLACVPLSSASGVYFATQQALWSAAPDRGRNAHSPRLFKDDCSLLQKCAHKIASPDRAIYSYTYPAIALTCTHRRGTATFGMDSAEDDPADHPSND